MSSSYTYIDENQEVDVLDGFEGSRIKRIVIIPKTKEPGVISLMDGQSGEWFDVYCGVSDLIQLSVIETISVELDIKSENPGGWRIKTGANVNCIVVGE